MYVAVGLHRQNFQFASQCVNFCLLLHLNSTFLLGCRGQARYRLTTRWPPIRNLNCCAPSVTNTATTVLRTFEEDWGFALVDCLDTSQVFTSDCVSDFSATFILSGLSSASGRQAGCWLLRAVWLCLRPLQTRVLDSFLSHLSLAVMAGSCIMFSSPRASLYSL